MTAAILSSSGRSAQATRAARALTAPVAAGLQPLPEPVETLEVPEEDLPEWTIATASAISDGPDFMHVLRRYAGKKTYKANTLYPPTGASN